MHRGCVAEAFKRDDLWQTIGDICNFFQPDECGNYFNAAGYGLI